MARLMKALKLKTTVRVLNLCPECEAVADMIDEDDSYYLECPSCGVQGYRYESMTIAIRDFQYHHSIPKHKPKKKSEHEKTESPKSVQSN